MGRQISQTVIIINVANVQKWRLSNNIDILRSGEDEHYETYGSNKNRTIDHLSFSDETA